MKKKLQADAPKTLADMAPGDVVRIAYGLRMVFPPLAGGIGTREYVTGLGCTSDLLIEPADTFVLNVLERGVERNPKATTGGSYDPVMGGSDAA